MNKKAILFTLFVFVVLSLCSCTNSMSSSEPITTPEPTATPEPEIELFENDNGQKGLRQGDNVIVDAVWDYITKYDFDEGVRYHVSLNNKDGLISDDGTFIIEPTSSWGHCSQIGNFLLTYSQEPKEDRKYDEEFGIKREGRATETRYNVKSNLINLSDGRKVCTLPSQHVIDIIENYVIYAYIKQVAEGWGLNAPSYEVEYKYMGLGVYDYKAGKNLFQDNYCSDIQLFPKVGFIATVADGNQKEANKYDRFYLMNGKETVHAKPVERMYYDMSGEGNIEYLPDVNLLMVNNGSSEMYYYELDGTKIEGCYQNHWERSITYNQNYLCTDGKIVNICFSDNLGIKYCYIDLTTRTIKQLKGVEEIKDFHDGMAAVANKKGMWGYINDKGELVYDYIFDNAGDFENGKASVVYNYSNKTIDQSGKIE